MAHPARHARPLTRSCFKATSRGRRHPRQSHLVPRAVPPLSLLPSCQVPESVKKQVENIVHTSIIQNAWANKKNVHVHGWVYELETGKLKDLNITHLAPWATA